MENSPPLSRAARLLPNCACMYVRREREREVGHVPVMEFDVVWVFVVESEGDSVRTMTLE